MPRNLTSVLALVLALGLAGCGEDQKDQLEDAGRSAGEKTAQAWKKLKAFSAEHKDEAVELWNKGMSSAKERFEKAKAKRPDLSEDVKRDLDEKWTAIERAYAKVKEVGADGWKTAHDAFVAAYDSFHEELKKHE